MIKQTIPSKRAIRAAACAWLALTLISTSAQADQIDPVTGEVWRLFDNAADGTQLGFRAATTDDFRKLLGDANWDARDSSLTTYDLTKGLNTSSYDGQTYFSENNIPNLSFGTARPMGPIYPWPNTSMAGWLQGPQGDKSAGFIEWWQSGASGCNSSRTGCSSYYSFLKNTNSAEIATEAELGTKFAPGALPTYFGVDRYNPLAGFRNAAGDITMGTYMIAAPVPEPSTQAFLGMGLLAVVLCAKRSRKMRQGV